MRLTKFFLLVTLQKCVSRFFKKLRAVHGLRRSIKQNKELVSCIFILLSRESGQCAIRARLGVASHLSTSPRWGNPAKCLSQRHNKHICRLVLHTVSSMLNVKQEAVNTNFKVIGLTRLGIKPESTAHETDALYHSAI